MWELILLVLVVGLIHCGEETIIRIESKSSHYCEIAEDKDKCLEDSHEVAKGVLTKIPSVDNNNLRD